MPRTIKTVLELSGEANYKKGLQSIDRALKAMSGELAAASAKFTENSASLKNVTNLSNAYKNQVEQQRVKVDSLKGAVDRSNTAYETAVQKYKDAVAASGENSKAALKAALAVDKAEKSLDSYKASLASAEKYLASSTKKMEEFASKNKNIAALGNAVDKIKEKIKSLSAVRNVTSAFDKLKGKASEIASKLEPVTSKLKKIKTGVDAVKGVFELAAKKAAAIKQKLEPAINVCKEVAKAAAKITFKTAEVGAKAVTTSVKTAAKAFKTYTTAVATAGVGIGAWAVKTGASFDAQMSTVASISGATGDELEALSAKAKEMGQTTSFSATESAQALEYMAMAGWNTTDMTNGLAGVINLAAASGEDLASVSDIVTDAMTAFGMSANQSEYFADVLAKTASSANTDVGMMGETFKYVAPLAGAMGYSIEDMSVAIGLMANAGIKGSMSGTSLKNIITNLADPTDDVATAMAELGISLENSDGTTKSFKETLSDLRSGFSGLTETQKAQYASTIAGKQGMSGLLALVNSSDADFDTLTKSIQECDGAAKKMSETKLDNLQGDLTLLKSNAEGVALSVSGKLNPALRFLVKAASGVITAFSERGIGGALTQVSTLVPKIVDTISQQLPTMITSFTTGFNSVVTSVLESIIAVLPVLINDVLPALIDGFNALIASLIEYLPEIIPLLLDGFVMLFSSMIDSVNLVLDQLIPMLPEIVTQISTTLIDNLPVILEGALQLFLGLIQSLDQVIEQLMPMLPQLITNLCDTLIAHIDEIVTAGFDLLIGLANGLVDCIPTLLTKVPEIINKLVGSLTEGDKLQQLIQAGIDLIVALAEGLPKAIPDIVLAIPKVTAAIIDELMKVDWLQVGIDILRGIGDGLVEGVGVIGGKVKEMASGLLDKVKGAFDINSPSRVFRDKVGIFLAQGVGVGFEEEMKKVSDDMNNAIPTSFNSVVNADATSFAKPKTSQNNGHFTGGTVSYIFENINIYGDKDYEDLGYRLERERQKAQLAMGV